MGLSHLALVYHSQYNLDLPGHVFPAHKYGHLYNKVKQDSRFSEVDILPPSPADQADLELVHSHQYLNDLFSYEHTPRTHYSELPLNRNIVESFLYGVGGTIFATELTDRIPFAFNMGGGYHHSFPDKAEGFCYLNDIAVAIRKRQLTRPNTRVLIVDLDLHQGNGNAYIFKSDPNVFTFSMHQDNIYPKKEESNLDIPLSPGIQDKEYLKKLDDALDEIQRTFKPQIVYYLAGADPYEDDSLGELKITLEGLVQRDILVRNMCKKLSIPCVITLAGGYARDFRKTIQIHFNTIQVFGDQQ